MAVIAAPPRYTYLDMVRGLAAFAVILVHYRWFYATGPGDWNSSFSHRLPLAGMLQPVYDHGGFAVQLFWLLSGAVFMIRYGRAPFDPGRFWVWRFARLYPLHLATLLLVTMLQLGSIRVSGSTTVYGHFDLYHFALQLVMASAWGFERGDSFNGPVWSVSVEVLIYLVFFIYASARRPGLAGLSVVVVIFTGLWLVLRTRWAQCGSLFFLGAALPPALAIGERHAARVTRAVALSAFPILLGASWIATARAGLYVPDIVYFYTLLPALLAAALACDAIARPLPRGWAWIGDSTYATYLMHMPILIAAKIWIDTRSDGLAILASPFTLALYVATVIGVALIVRRTFERPMQRAIQRRYDTRGPRTAIDAEIERTI